MNFAPDYPERARESAEHFYKDVKLNCAESAMKALLTNCGFDCPVELLRVASGFGGGIGKSGCTCGALSGSVMAASILFGRTEDTGCSPSGCTSLAHKLHDAFRAHHKATCCRVLRHGLEHGTDAQKAACAKRTGETVEIAARILMEHAAGETKPSAQPAPCTDDCAQCADKASCTKA